MNTYSTCFESRVPSGSSFGTVAWQMLLVDDLPKIVTQIVIEFAPALFFWMILG